MSVSANFLVVDDEEVMRDSCRQVLSSLGVSVRTAKDGIEGLDAVRDEAFDVVILDLRMPGMDGMELLKRIKEESPGTIVIVITGYATVESAVEAMKMGAYDYLPKPFTPDEMRAVIARALEKKELLAEREYLRDELRTRVGTDLVVGENSGMRTVLDLISRVGPTDSTVLITGESGTGKELIARTIHRLSLRSARPFVVVDCGALVENLFESELFGHVKGAFTGAVVTKHGRFELANGGTLFFDEIGNISLNIQAKLLRVIQEREVTKVGGTRPVRIDVRIIAATNKNLQEMMKEGTFRDDLYYRLGVVPINLPSLRERRQDIPLLAEHFLKEYNRRRKKDITEILPEAVDLLVKYEWPGNVRELENTIERAVVLTGNSVIGPDDLVCQGLLAGFPENSRHRRHGHLAEVEGKNIQEALETFNGNRTRAAKFLGIDRKTLLRKMKRYGVREED